MNYRRNNRLVKAVENCEERQRTLTTLDIWTRSRWMNLAGYAKECTLGGTELVWYLLGSKLN